MRFGFGFGIDRPPFGIDPRSLFAAGVNGAWWDIKDASATYQDEAGTTPVTTLGQHLAFVRDKSPNGNNLSIAPATAPTLGALSSGARAMSFNGSSQYILGNGVASFFGGTGRKWTLHIAFSQEAAGGTTLFALGNSALANPYVWLQATTPTTLRSLLSTKSTVGAVKNQAVFTASKNSQVFTVRVDGAVVDCFVNGVKIVSSGEVIPAVIDLDRFSIGALVRNTISAYGKVKVSEVVITDTAQSDSTVSWVSSYLYSRNVEALDYSAEPADLFVVAGQSNAEGRGTSGPSVTNGSYFQQGGSLTKLADPVGGALTGSPWPAFANKYYQLTGRRAAICEYAAGGSAMLAAASASSNWSSTGVHRGVATLGASDAIAYLSGTGKFNYQKCFVLWCQGEQDASVYNGTTVTDALYQAEMESLFNYFKANIPGLDGMLVSELGAHRDGTGEANWALIRAAQAAAIANVPGSYMAFTGAKDFPAQSKMSDTVHYTQAGYNEMGEALATYAASLL